MRKAPTLGTMCWPRPLLGDMRRILCIAGNIFFKATLLSAYAFAFLLVDYLFTAVTAKPSKNSPIYRLLCDPHLLEVSSAGSISCEKE